MDTSKCRKLTLQKLWGNGKYVIMPKGRQINVLELSFVAYM